MIIQDNNETLSYRKNVYEQNGKPVSNHKSHNIPPQWKKGTAGELSAP
ncbi:MAG TPA: hypothetical protein VK436_02015 [Methanocella sp.]|nr:hypothetical protein [Methanocella sp.]